MSPGMKHELTRVGSLQVPQLFEGGSVSTDGLWVTTCQLNPGTGGTAAWLEVTGRSVIEVKCRADRSR